MTRDEAITIFDRIGCMEPRNLALAHIAYMHYIDRLGRGECQQLPVSEAYAILTKKEPPAIKQAALFEKTPSAL